MYSPWLNAVWITCVAAWVLHGFLRSKKDLSEILEPLLRARGFTLLRSEVPPRFVTGPFPQGVVSFARGGTWLPPTCWQYRRVVFLDSSGAEHVAWSRILFRGNRQQEVDWVPDLSEISRIQNKSVDHISHSSRCEKNGHQNVR
jgi:hypothetical protein